MRIRIGTRGSRLALVQAQQVGDLLERKAGVSVELVKIVTSGDRIQDRDLAEIGGKGLFIKEIEEALYANEVDIAVHSMKDLPAQLPDGLEIAAVLPREDVRDALVSVRYGSVADLPPGGVVGTSSVRRKHQLLALRPDLEVVSFRGNVTTRLSKLEAGEVDATILATAGLNRLGMAHVINELFDLDQMLPAVAQGAVGVECRSEDEAVKSVLATFNDAITAIRVGAERAVLQAIGGDCKTPLAAYADVDAERLLVRGWYLCDNGGSVTAELSGAVEDALLLGKQVGEQLLDQSA